MEKLNINALKVSIDNKTILNDISFTLPKGETLPYNLLYTKIIHSQYKFSVY